VYVEYSLCFQLWFQLETNYHYYVFKQPEHVEKFQQKYIENIQLSTMYYKLAFNCNTNLNTNVSMILSGNKFPNPMQFIQMSNISNLTAWVISLASYEVLQQKLLEKFNYCLDEKYNRIATNEGVISIDDKMNMYLYVSNFNITHTIIFILTFVYYYINYLSNFFKNKGGTSLCNDWLI